MAGVVDERILLVLTAWEIARWSDLFLRQA